MIMLVFGVLVLALLLNTFMSQGWSIRRPRHQLMQDINLLESDK